MKAQKILTLSITVFLIAVLAGLYFWRVERSENAPSEEDRPPTSVSLFNREESEVVEVAFYAGGADGVRTYARPFTDDFGMLQWSYFGSYFGSHFEANFEANSEAGNFALLSHMIRDKARPTWILSATGIAHENSDGLDLADFGLAPPAVTAEAVFYDGSRNILHLGSQTADLQFYFAMREGDPAIYLINAVLGVRLLYGVCDMLDLSLPVMDINNVEYVRIAARGAEPIVLIDSDENGGGQLIFHTPLEGMPLSHSHFLERIFDPLELMRVRELAELLPENLQTFGLAEPSLEFIFRTRDGEVHLKFGDVFDGFIYIMDASRPHVFIAEATAALGIIATEPMQIADRSLALVSIEDVAKVTIEGEEISLEFIPTESDVTRHAFRQIIGLIADAEIENFTPPAAPEFTITHHHGTTTELRFYNYNANFLAVITSVDDISGDSFFATSRLATERIFEILKTGN
ncbi:MAG: DUF4340 domain-containing protein [Defluviitaleaceae bacterium]|nr:DUF4340 domain-containing protein [Defluviitaleaceae bacterium]